MRSTYLTALVIGCAVVGWLVSGQLDNVDTPAAPSLAEQARDRDAAAQDPGAPAAVRVSPSVAFTHTVQAAVSGQTRSKYVVDVTAEATGRVAERPARLGDRVSQGDLLCRIETDDQLAVLADARASVAEAMINATGSRRLHDRGLLSDAESARVQANLVRARTTLARAELGVRRLTITAPFDGIVDAVHAEAGAYVTPGSTCVTLVAPHPMVITAQLSEDLVGKVSIGATARAHITGVDAPVTGLITYIGMRSERSTRTFPVEIEVPNPDAAIRSGASARLDVPLAALSVHRISSALLSMDATGHVGVRTVNGMARVDFYPVTVVTDGEDGMLVTGLPPEANIITVGQAQVAAGDTVAPTFVGAPVRGGSTADALLGVQPVNAMIDWAIHRSRTTLLAMLMIVLGGLVARFAIPIENDPSIAVPFFVVTVVHEGISPEDAERLLVMPLEIELRQVEGVEEITAWGSEGAATMFVEFDAGMDLFEAELDLREAVDRARPELPQTAREPVVSARTTSDFPIIQVNLAGDGISERVLYDTAIDLRDAIRGITSVLDAELRGAREEQLEIVIDPVRLEAYALTPDDVLGAVSRNNRLIAAGALDGGQGRFSVKIPSIIASVDDLAAVPVRASADAVVTLGDIATIRRTFKDAEGFARVNGRDAITINVQKRSNGNVIDTVNRVQAVVAGFEPRLPAGVEVFYTQNQAPFAAAQVNELQGNILTALALVMVLVVAAMGLRNGVIVGLGIPVSFLFALIFIYAVGYTFNFMVMFGMLLGLGMLIDGAIVVTEYADRKMAEGLSSRDAFAAAAKRMFWPVTASTATTLAAFLPLVFWPGVSGKFMMYLPVTVFTVLIGSLLYALVFGPVIGALIGRPGRKDDPTLAVLEGGDPRTLPGATGLYARTLHFVCRRPLATTLVMLATLFGVFSAYGTYGRGMMFFSDSEPRFAIVSVHAQGNLAAAEVDRLVREVEREVLEIPGIRDVNTSSQVAANTGRGALDTIGTLFVDLLDENERALTGTQILEQIRTRSAALAGIRIEVRAFEQGPPVGKPIQIQFSAYDRNLLAPAVAQVREHIELMVSGVRDLEDTRALPGIEWTLSIDRGEAARYGVDVAGVGTAVQLVTNGVKVGEYRPDRADDAVDIRMRYPEQVRGLAALDALRIPTSNGLVPIGNFVKRVPEQQVDSVQRIDGTPVMFIRANVAPGVLADEKVAEISAWLDSRQWPAGLAVDFRGANEEQADSMQFVGMAFSMSLLLMFVLLVTQFNSLYQAALILVAVIMSTAGVLLGLLITGSPFSAILTGVGVVALAGIVVNNNIVLIDTFNQLRRATPDAPVIDLVVRTGAQRLRPVMLTTVTTVFGLLPLASNLSIDIVNRDIVYGGQLSSFWVPLSQAIVSGLTFATVLTLVATPAMLMLPERVRSIRMTIVSGIGRLSGRLSARGTTADTQTA